MMTLKTNYFYGNEVSEYGKEHGYLDYRTLAKSFDAVLNNEIMQKTYEIGYWDIVSGCEYDEETDTYTDIYQFYIVDDNGAEILRECDEIVFYTVTTSDRPTAENKNKKEQQKNVNCRYHQNNFRRCSRCAFNLRLYQ